ncbi:hypothetical protein [Demequina oxidasica]|uniref:hypothetical protein n=1 Tax=Demequina oxidasica TaxID=676199 RepID=UPI000783F7FE|nr:hypothetical protein [Demequina oxidasica]
MKIRFATPIAIAFATATLLTACSNPLDDLGDNIAEAGAEKVAEGLTGVDVDLDLDGSGASLPDDWPSEVVIPDGKIVAAFSAEGSHVVQMVVAGPEALDQMVSNLEDAGFTDGGSSAFGDLVVRIMQNDDLAVSIGYTESGDEHGLNMTVTRIEE